jgi:excisionase family DNA binding protein
MSTYNRPIEPLLLSVSHVAKLIGFSRTKTYEMVQSGKIPSILVENRLRITRHALYAWIAQQPRSTPHARARSF